MGRMLTLLWEVIRFWLRFALGLGVLSLAYFGQALVLARIPANPDFQPTPDGILIFVQSNGVHTDLVLPVQTAVIDWTTFVPPEQFRPADQPFSYISFGWGELELYREVPVWADFTPGIAVRSMLLPTRSALHISYLEQQPTPTSWVRPLHISTTQYNELVQHILASFRLDEQGQIINLNCCWYAGWNDNFYDSPAAYHLFATCNNWTNEALQKAGLPTGRAAIFDTDILRYLADEP